MKLYSYWRSSSAWRVRIALTLKNVAHELIPVHLLEGGGQQHRPEFRARNPLAQVPVLELFEDGHEFRLSQSMAIIEYLEERHPLPPLLPREPELRARARQLAEMINSGIQPMQNLALQQKIRAAGVEPLSIVRGLVEVGLTALEVTAQTTAGKFLLNDALSIADVFLVPQLFAARRLDIDIAAFPTLRQIELTCEAIPAFQAAHPRAQPDFEP
jgi:maleylpyruvate isomerase